MNKALGNNTTHADQDNQKKVALAQLGTDLFRLKMHVRRGKALLSSRPVKPVPPKKELERVRVATQERVASLSGSSE